MYHLHTAVMTLSFEMVAQVRSIFDGIHHGVHDRVEYDHRQGVPLVNPNLQSNQRCGPVGRGECYREIGVERSDKVKELGGGAW